MRDEGMALIVTSGGLGPTADDLTAEIVGRFCGREMVLDARLEERIAEILRPLMARWPDLDPEAIRASNRKQAVIPDGATVLEPGRHRAGAGRPAARRRRPRPWWCCPGRRASCSRCGRRPAPPSVPRPRSPAPPSTAARSCGCSGSRSPRSPTRCGPPRRPGSTWSRWRSPPACGAARSRSPLATSRRPRPPMTRCWTSSASATRDTLFSQDGSTIDEQVAGAAGRAHVRGRRVLHRGLLAARFTDRAGLLGLLPRWRRSSTPTRPRSTWPASIPALIERFGAVSTEVAEALAEGIAQRFDAEFGVGITGDRRPGRRAPRRSRSGLVCFSVCAAGDGRRSPAARGSRAAARTSATARSPWPCTCCAACCSARPTSSRSGRGRRRRRVSDERARLFVALELRSRVRARGPPGPGEQAGACRGCGSWARVPARHAVLPGLPAGRRWGRSPAPAAPRRAARRGLTAR